MLPLLGLSLAQLQELALSLGLPKFTGKQMAQWLYQKGVTQIDEMTNLSKNARMSLAATHEVGARGPVKAQRSIDGTIKYLFPTQDGQCVETVYIPDGKRATLCVSCQVGCKMGCKFCMTGRQGFVSSLSAADIYNQIAALPEREKLTNVVFMGQGEPMDNLDAVLAVTEILTADWGHAWSPKRITVSSVGVLPQLKTFIEKSPCHLAISLHHPVPVNRALLMPVEKAFGIQEVVALLKQYPAFRRRKGVVNDDDESRQRRLSFEYIVFKDVNDSIRHADALLRLLDGLECRVNLIRFHDIPDTDLKGVGDEQMTQFRDYLTHHGLFTTIRASRGQDIYAACGLLNTKNKNTRQQ